MQTLRYATVPAVLILLAGCYSTEPKPSTGHIMGAVEWGHDPQYVKNLEVVAPNVEPPVKDYNAESGYFLPSLPVGYQNVELRIGAWGPWGRCDTWVKRSGVTVRADTTVTLDFKVSRAEAVEAVCGRCPEWCGR